MTPDLQAKYARLQAILREMGAVVIGLSGGVDSTLLVKVAYDTLGERCLAVIGKSEAFPEGEIEEALHLAQQIGVRVRIVPTHELHNPLFRVNRPDRCYHCKTELYGVLRRVADEEASRGLPTAHTQTTSATTAPACAPRKSMACAPRCWKRASPKPTSARWHGIWHCPSGISRRLRASPADSPTVH